MMTSTSIMRRSIPLYRTASAIRLSAPRPLLKSLQTQIFAAWTFPIDRHFSTQTVEGPSSIEVEATLPNIPHMKASTRRTFSPNSNAQAMLLSGGDNLAENASFDPIYSRAKNYIRNHPVGPAVISPILIHGLVGALIESKLPQSFFVENSLRQARPLVVGVEVEAQYEVVSVLPSASGVGFDDGRAGNDLSHIGRIPGYELKLETSVRRVSDGALIAEGQQTVWLPDYVSNSV